jgi:hypothetical protein
MMTPKLYQSFEEFEREELRSLSRLHVSVDDMLDSAFVEELDFEPGFVSKRRSEEEDDEE